MATKLCIAVKRRDGHTSDHKPDPKFVAAGHAPRGSRRHVHHSATGSLVRSGFVMRTSLSENQLFQGRALGPVDIRGFPPTRECDSRSRLRRAILIRRELTNAQWRRIEPLIPGKEGDKGRHGEDNRLFVDAVLWLVRAGAPWRDLPEEFGKWNSVFRRFRRWARRGVWKRLFTELGEDPDLEYLIIDSTIVRAHQHASGAKKGGAKMRRSAVRAAA
jgi:transposase